MVDHSDEDMSSLQSPTSYRSPGTPQHARRSVLVPTNNVTTKEGLTVRSMPCLDIVTQTYRMIG